MAKKKKTQLKSVARGFATTSVPKKVAPTVDHVEPDATSTSATNPYCDVEDTNADQSADLKANGEAEEDPFQDLVEKLQERTEKEIVRTCKAIEVERRLSKELPVLDLDQSLTDEIITLELECSSDATPRYLDETEEKAIFRLGIAYGVLRRLGFNEETVEECLRSIPGIDLEEAYEWLCLHCSEAELQGKEKQIEKSPGKKQRPLKPPTATEIVRKDSPPRLDPNAPTFVPMALSIDLGIPLHPITPMSMEQDSVPVLAHPKFLDGGQDKLSYTKNDATPIQQDSGRELPISLSDFPAPEQLALEGVACMEPPFSEDIFDNEDDSSDGLLALLEIPASGDFTSNNSTIRMYDMTSPKHWSGRAPKLLLADSVSKIDKYAIVTYQLVSGSSIAKRMAVKICWEGKRMDEWVMEDVACRDENQAQQYIATVALYAMTYPQTEGFAAGAFGVSGGPTFFRTLPVAFRNLWDELDAARKAKEDSVNRTVWAKLQSILQLKLERSAKGYSRDEKGNMTTSRPRRGHGNNSLADASPQRLMADFVELQQGKDYQDMLVQRNKLPIAQFKKEILDTLGQSQILVISGETGCGKSTQIPSYILEHELLKGKSCRICVTEPRRISAISLAQRVSHELGEPPNSVGTPSSLVGYSIRLESNTSRNTRLTFMTNGIALRMLESGSGQDGDSIGFDEITHIIVDEVHERSIESDFLLIVLKSLIRQRPELKVILMSATLDADKVSEYFGGCPTMHIPGRTFPVDTRFLEDAIECTKWSISESSPYARKMHDKYYNGKARQDWTEEQAADDEDDSDNADQTLSLEKRYSDLTATTINTLDERLILYDLIIRLLEMICFENPSLQSYSAAILIFMPGISEIRRINDLLAEHPHFGVAENFRILSLHSTLSSESQNAVFDIPPQGMRKIVIATNIAETGVTIPDITCVIDTGKHREMRFDEKRQISRLVETFVARSNAAQRRGRAGRVQPGLCFHLFTKLRHDTQMVDHPLPEIMRLSLSDLALRIKIMKVNLGSSIEDVLSRALDPPVAINVQRAIAMLVEAGALTMNEDITPMGRLLSKLPTDVHLGKFLLIATVFRCLDPALTIAAALSSKSPFLSPLGLEQEADRAKQTFRIENSDFLTIHNVFNIWRRLCSGPGGARSFCRANYLSHQNLQQIEELRQQFLGYLIDSGFIRAEKSFLRELSRSRYSRGRTRFVSVPSEFNCNSERTPLINAALTAGLYPKLLIVERTTGQMRTITNNQISSFHPSSVNFGRKPVDLGANYLTYFTLMHSKKLYAWETGPSDDLAIVLLCGDAESKLASDTMIIDRKIRYHVSPKTNAALKLLRTRISVLLSQQFRGKPLLESHVLWNDLSVRILGKQKAVDEKTIVMGTRIYNDAYGVGIRR